MGTELNLITGNRARIEQVSVLIPRLDRFELNDAGVLSDYELFLLETRGEIVGIEVGSLDNVAA